MKVTPWLNGCQENLQIAESLLYLHGDTSHEGRIIS